MSRRAATKAGESSRYVEQLEKRIEEKDMVIGVLRDELAHRNEEIVRRNERERETNILIRGLQNLVLQLQPGRARSADVLDGDPLMRDADAAAGSADRPPTGQHLAHRGPTGRLPARAVARLRDQEVPLREIERVELLVPGEVPDEPADRVQLAEAPRPFLVGHALQLAQPLVAREAQLCRQRMDYPLPPLSHFVALPCIFLRCSRE